MKKVDQNGIAIIGMSGRFPGAKNIEMFWNNLSKGVESITRFSDEELPKTDLEKPNYVKARGVIEGVADFDADFFGMSGREAELTDPQHRLFLECCYEGLEDAGYALDQYDGAIGVYAGASSESNYYYNILTHPEVRKESEKNQLRLGNELDYLTTRVSYKLNLKGPSMAIQTACSTSLVTVCMACSQLLAHQCDIALAGGATISIPQERGYHYQEGMIFSSDGHCRPFDAKSEGTVPGNGVGVVVLKRLDEAVRDGDHIYAVIRGFGLNNDGSDKIGYSAPSIEGQARAMRRAFKMAGIAPETISLVEAHGTATLLGDPIEIQALGEVFGTGKRKQCAIGSVKSNIGHLMETAGIAGLIKAALAVHHKTLPASLHFKEPNPHIDFEASPFYVPGETKPWKDGPRRALVNSLGFGGTNAHVILEEPPQNRERSDHHKKHLFVLSAKSKEALQEAAKRLKNHLEKHPELDLGDVAYTLQVGRTAFSHRKAFVASSQEEVLEQLAKGSEVGDPATELERMGLDWMRGEAVDWSHIHDGDGCRRVSLPTYPFEKKRYWLDFKSEETKPNETKSKSGKIQDSIIEIWKEHLGLDEVDITDNFFDLGGDSFLAIQMVPEIQERLGVSLKVNTILQYPTIAKLTAFIEKERETTSEREVVLLKEGDPSCPLFVIHQIDGHVFSYKQLANVLQDQGQIYGIESPYSSSDSSLTIEWMASDYIETIKKVQPKGPYRILGASFGGLVAYEIAQQLDVDSLTMIDIINPTHLKQDANTEDDMFSLLLELFSGKKLLPDELKKLSREEKIGQIMLCMNFETLPFSEQERIFENMKIHWNALKKYQPKPYTKRICFFETEEKLSSLSDISLASTWEDLGCDKIESHVIAATHLGIMGSPYVEEVAKLIDVFLHSQKKESPDAKI